MEEDLKMIKQYEKEFCDTYSKIVTEENDDLIELYGEKLKQLAMLIARHRQHFKLSLIQEAAKKAQA